MPEIERRTAAALAAIKASYGTAEAEYAATLFVSHHLEEIEAAYWTKHFGDPTPEPAQILDKLVLRSHWSDEDDDGLDTFDFTLPDDATDYVLSVQFDDDGNVEAIVMES